MRANPDRQRHLLHVLGGGHRVPPAPSRGTLKTRKETMSAFWRSLVLKPKSATRSGQKTTISTPNIISDRCAQTQKGRKRSCCDSVAKMKLISEVTIFDTSTSLNTATPPRLVCEAASFGDARTIFRERVRLPLLALSGHRAALDQRPL